jgi:hypothetical protein
LFSSVPCLFLRFNSQLFSRACLYSQVFPARFKASPSPDCGSSIPESPRHPTSNAVAVAARDSAIVALERRHLNYTDFRFILLMYFAL